MHFVFLYPAAYNRRAFNSFISEFVKLAALFTFHIDKIYICKTKSVKEKGKFFHEFLRVKHNEIMSFSVIIFILTDSIYCNKRDHL